jgi:translation elongation factor P/translation initiation factor 5A
LWCCRAACRQVEAGQLRKGDFFEFKGKRCVVIKTSQQINNRKLFAIVEFRETESGAKHRETIQAAVLFEKFFVTGQKCNFLYFDEGQEAVYFQDPETFEQV